MGPAAAKMDGAKERQSKTTSLTYVGEARRAAHPARPEQDERLRERVGLPGASAYANIRSLRSTTL